MPERTGASLARTEQGARADGHWFQSVPAMMSTRVDEKGGIRTASVSEEGGRHALRLVPTSEATLGRGFPAPWLGESLRNFFLGGVAGAIGAYLTYPVNFVKMQLQYQKRAMGAAMLGQDSSVHYRGAWDCFRQVVRSRGFTGLFQGVVPQILGVAPEKAIKLATNDAIRAFFAPMVRSLEGGASKKDEHPMLSPANAQWLVDVGAGACGGASQVIFTNVGEILMVRLALKQEIASSAGAASSKPKGMMDIIRELGLRGLYTGSGPCLARDSIFAAIFFPLYYRLRDTLPVHLASSVEWFGMTNARPTAAAASPAVTDNADPALSSNVAPQPGSTSHLQSSLVAGVIAGSIAAGLTTPFDVIKTTMQAHRGQHTRAYHGMRDCARRLYVEEGASAFWKGFAPRMARSAPQFGLTLLAYEVLQMWWQRFFGPTGVSDEEAPLLDVGEWASDSS
jgi:solute carrier family 25 aspartate/glutamate transporter 12/13